MDQFNNSMATDVANLNDGNMGQLSTDIEHGLDDLEQGYDPQQLQQMQQMQQQQQQQQQQQLMQQQMMQQQQNPQTHGQGPGQGQGQGPDGMGQGMPPGMMLTPQQQQQMMQMGGMPPMGHPGMMSMGRPPMNGKGKGGMMKNLPGMLKEPALVAVLFVLLSLPQVNDLLSKQLPMLAGDAGTNIIAVGVKGLIIAVIFLVLKMYVLK